MSKHHDWSDCVLCPRKRPDQPIQKIRFSHAYSSDELVCDFCRDILKEEGKVRREEICQICFGQSLQTRTVILENFFKPLGKKCPRCDKQKENSEENGGEKNSKKHNKINNIFNTCAGCQKDISQETSYYLAGEALTRHWCANCYPTSNDNSSPPSVSTPLSNSSSQNQTNQSNLKCHNCKKNFNYGDNTHYFSQKPDKKWCDACDPEIKICLDATQKIFQNQTVNVDNLNISNENKEQLKALIKIKKGELVDIDKLNIDQEAKAELKEIQKQLFFNSPTNNPQSNLDSKPNNWPPYLSWIIGGVVTTILLIPYLIWRQKKIQAYKKQGKKIPWWI